MDRESADELLTLLRADAQVLAQRFALRYRAIEAERPNVKRRYGVCFADGTIRVRLLHARTGQPLRYSSLVNTLCHELAHLRHFNHGLRFRRLYLEILEYARDSAIYRPGRADAGVTVAAARAPARAPRASNARSTPQGPSQLTLFG
jgi:predicted metal-dependent hydrolase